jgi:hypothetical protein
VRRPETFFPLPTVAVRIDRALAGVLMLAAAFDRQPLVA